MSISAFTALFVAALLAGVVLKLWLATRHVRHVAAHRHSVPAAFAQRISLAAHGKAADYTIAKARLGMLELTFGAAVALAWTLLGGLDILNQALLAWLGEGLVQQLAVLAAFVLIGLVLDLPFSLYGTFVLEEKFGFNTMSIKLWTVDALKGVCLGAIIGLPIAALMLWLMGAAGGLWWLWVWAVWIGFNALLLFIYPNLIAPLFNTFKPLEDEALSERVRQLMSRCGFAAQGLYVMDASQRSAHGNAYFTGFGASKRVVFFDTLLQSLTPGELEAVLAHELGHFKHKHIVKRILSLFALSFFGFATLGFLSEQVWFYIGLGVRPIISETPGANAALALLLFMMAVPVFTAFVSPLVAQLSRRHEFEADAYAVQHASARDLKTALLKLYEDNACTLTPDPLYVKFYASHPPAVERLARIGA